MRKNYAVFCSMGKSIKIGVLAVSYSIIALKGSMAAAQTSGLEQDTAHGKEHSIGDVVVQNPAAVPAAGAITALMTSGDIEAAPAHNLEQLLDYASSIDIRQRGTSGVQADVRMRGGSEEQTLILLNGINIADPRTGHHSLNLPIDLAAIDRIEIVQTPAAFAGAINIVTGGAPTAGVTAGIGAGSHRYAEQSLHLHYAQPKYALTAALSRQESGGYMHNTDFDILNAFVQGAYRFANGGKLNAQAGFQQKAFGANNFYSVGPNEYEHVRTLIYSLSYVQPIGNALVQANAYHRRSYDNYCKHRDSLGFASYDRRQDNYHQGDVIGGDLYAEYQSIIGKTTLGALMRAEHIFSNKLGDPMEREMPSFESGISYTHAKWRSALTALVRHACTLRRLTLAGGAAGSYSNSFGYYTLLNAQADYQLTPHCQMRLSAYQSLRLPTFTDLYYNGKGYLPNPFLEPERAATIELGARYHRRRFSANAAAYYRRGSRLIDWVYVNETTQQCQNYAAIDAYGAEAGAGYSLNPYLRNVRVSYAFLHMKPLQSHDDKAKGRLFAYLKHKVGVSCAHTLGAISPHLQASWSVSREWRNGSYRPALNSAAAVPFAPLTLVDVRLQWQQAAFTLYLSADNILDTRYYDYNAVPQAGRWVKTGVKVGF